MFRLVEGCGQTGAMLATDPPWFALASAVPLVATEWLGLGPFHQPRRSSPSRLTSLTLSATTLYAAIETLGVTGGQILSVLSWYGGSVKSGILAAETPGADPSDVAESVDRMVAAGLVTRSADGHLRVADSVDDVLAPVGVSLTDQHAVTSDELGQVCQVLGIRPAPTRKQERLDAIAAHFAGPNTASQVMTSLSDRGRSLLLEIAEVNGPRVIDPIQVGFGNYSLHRAGTPRYAASSYREHLPDEVVPLAELTAHGIVGLDSWNHALWIWREAWPMLGHPLHRRWTSVRPPATGPAIGRELRLPPLVGLAERALQHWDQVPPAVLKSGDPRLAKGALRSTAKTLGTDEATIGIIATAALSMGLLLPNTVRASGRGRNRTVDQVWLADPEMRAAWTQAAPPTRWLRLVGEWTNPRTGGSNQLVANRHLILWELGDLDDGVGWVDDADVGRWIEHRYASIAVDEAVVECIRDLRALGMVTADGPVALTELGRLALDDATEVERVEFGSATTAIVQADETIVCPPDLDAALVVRAGEVARLESDSGARIFRLDETMITKAVQRGQSAQEIVDFLEGLSSVPLPDTVRTLVADAAGRAERVRIVEATTVVVTADPVDLATACSMKSAKLTLVSDTVAVSPLTADKVRQILDRKGLAPTVTSADADGLRPRRSSEDAAALERAAQRHREFAGRHHADAPARQAEFLEQQAAAARDPSSKLSVQAPLAVTPALLRRVGP